MEKERKEYKVAIKPYASYTPEAREFIENRLGTADGYKEPIMRNEISYVSVLLHAFPEIKERNRKAPYTEAQQKKAERFLKKYTYACMPAAEENKLLRGEPVILKAKYSIFDVIYAAQRSKDGSDLNDDRRWMRDPEAGEPIRWSEFCAKHYCCNGITKDGQGQIMTIDGLEKRLLESSAKIVEAVIAAGGPIDKKVKAENKVKKQEEAKKIDEWSHSGLYEVIKLNKLYCPMPDKEIYEDDDRPPMDYDIADIKEAYKEEKSDYFGFSPDKRIFLTKWARTWTPVSQAVREGWIYVKSPYNGTGYLKKGDGESWIREADLGKWFSQRKTQYKKKLKEIISQYERHDAEFEKAREEAYPIIADEWDRSLPSRLYVEAHYLPDDTRRYLDTAKRRRDKERGEDETMYFWRPFVEGYAEYLGEDVSDLCDDVDGWIENDELTEDEVNGVTFKAYREQHEEKELSEDEEEMLRRQEEAYDLDDDFLSSVMDRWDDD